MTAILTALAALFAAAAKNDWTTAVAEVVVLIQAVVAAFPAHVQPTVKNALAKVVAEHHTTSAAPGVEDHGHFME